MYTVGVLHSWGIRTRIILMRSEDDDRWPLSAHSHVNLIDSDCCQYHSCTGVISFTRASQWVYNGLWAYLTKSYRVVEDKCSTSLKSYTVSQATKIPDLVWSQLLYLQNKKIVRGENIWEDVLGESSKRILGIESYKSKKRAKSLDANWTVSPFQSEWD